MSVSEAKSVFQALDTNGDGELDPKELQCRLSDFGVEDQHIELLFYKLDQNHDNVIDLQEFIDGYDQYMSLVTNGTFLNSTRELVDKHMLTTDDAIPAGAEMVTNWSGGKIKLYKSTYPANDPSEDRSTLVIGDDFLWCGVWDGHGGTPCSEFSQTRIYENFKKAIGDTRCSGVQDAFAYSYITTDGEYLAHAGTDPAALFAGTCAVGAYIDLKTQTIGVSNLGDSRAVVGVFGEKEIRTIPMSEDHTAADDDERKRVEDAHPKDPTCVVQMSEDDDDWRVKQICAFTRSIGDCQMKDKTASTLYNTYTKRKVMPRPGVKAKGEAHKTKPYIVNTPDYSEHKNMKDGFLIVGCDGVWDEMSSEEAVNICAKLILDNAKDAKADIAELFINEVLKKAVVRCQESYEEEENMTLAELKARPQGKKDFAHRSCLHDDITVLIYHFMSDGSDAGVEVYSEVVEAASQQSETKLLSMAREIFDKIDVDGSGSITSDELALLSRKSGKPIQGEALVKVMAELDVDGSGEVDFGEFSAWWPKYCARLTSSRNRSGFDGVLGEAVNEVASQQSEDRAVFDAQLFKIIRYFDGKDAAELRDEFLALDEDNSGELDLDECHKLVAKVFGADVDPKVVNACFDQMDEDNSKAVDFDEFCSFFGVKQ